MKLISGNFKRYLIRLSILFISTSCATNNKNSNNIEREGGLVIGEFIIDTPYPENVGTYKKNANLFQKQNKNFEDKTTIIENKYKLIYSNSDKINNETKQQKEHPTIYYNNNVSTLEPKKNSTPINTTHGKVNIVHSINSSDKSHLEKKIITKQPSNLPHKNTSPTSIDNPTKNIDNKIQNIFPETKESKINKNIGITFLSEIEEVINDLKENAKKVIENNDNTHKNIIKNQQFYSNDNSNTTIILSHGLGANQNSLNKMKNTLSPYGKILTPCRSNYNHLSIYDQAKCLEPEIIKELQNKNLKKLVLLGHSLGGNITLKVLRNIIEKYPNIIYKIKKENVQIRIILLGAPLKGSVIASKLPKSFLKLIGIDLSYIAMQELAETSNISKVSIEDLTIIESELKDQVKILPIIGKSNFINSMTNVLQNLNFLGVNLLDVLNNLNILDIENTEKFYETLNSIEENDGIVTINSQRGADILPKGLLLNQNFNPIENTCHVCFDKYIPRFIKIGLPQNEDSELDSERVNELIVYGIKN